jgi:hypothetical protein
MPDDRALKTIDLTRTFGVMLYKLIFIFRSVLWNLT